MRHLRFGISFFALAVFSAAAGAAPVRVEPVNARHGMVVAGHPEAADIGADVLKAGGNAMDAAVAVSLALGVAEPYGSGLGGKLMLLYFEAKTGKTFAIDAMDEASRSLDPNEYRKRDERARYDGWSSVCVPGLAAGLHVGHTKWGARPWAENVEPAIKLARNGFTVLPKTRDLFEERLEKLRGDPDLARLFLASGELPAAGTKLRNEELAQTMEVLAQHGADGIYRGVVAEKLVDASRRGGGLLTLEDLARYQARVVEPLEISFRGMRIIGAPAPTNGAPLVLGILKVLENYPLEAPLRSAANLDLIGQVWRAIYPEVQRSTGDWPGARAAFEKMVSPDKIEAVFEKLQQPAALGRLDGSGFFDTAESVHASTTHFVIADRHGNVVCATQSQSLHFGAGVAAAGIVMNDSMSNFSMFDERHPNFIAPGRRPRSTISPTIVLRNGRPILAIGIPGASRIPTAVTQVLLDHLVLQRPMAESIGDTRVHWYDPFDEKKPEVIEAERSLAQDIVEQLKMRGWDVNLREAAGTGRHFGGINAVTLNSDGTYTGYADPRRTNVAVGPDR